MFSNLFWVSIIIVVFGVLFYIFFHYYEKSKDKGVGKQSGLFRIKFKYYILMFTLMLGIAVTGFFYANNRKIFAYYSVDVGVVIGKYTQDYIDNDRYDRCIAFGNLVSINRLIDIDIINEEEEQLLLDSRSIWNPHPTYNIYFVQKDDVDYILIMQSNRQKNIFMFKSRLPYSFDELLSLFEETSNTELSNEFLHKENTGIFFVITKVNLDYQYAFISEINSQKYYAYYDKELVILK